MGGRWEGGAREVRGRWSEREVRGSERKVRGR